MSDKFRALFLSSISLIAATVVAVACAGSAAASEPRPKENNAVAEYLESATENTRGADHRQVLEQALTDMLDLPVQIFFFKQKTAYEMHPHAWAITLVLQNYISPKREDLPIGGDGFFDDVKKPEAQRAIRAWLVKLHREDVTGARPRRPRNTVEDYLNGAEAQYETDAQRAVFKQAFADMLNEPVASLRKKRYPDYQLHPGQWPLTELLYSYIVPDPLIWFDDDELFRDVKKPEARAMIQKWLDFFDSPGLYDQPAREERP